jgi:hypothetical protein
MMTIGSYNNFKRPDKFTASAKVAINDERFYGR